MELKGNHRLYQSLGLGDPVSFSGRDKISPSMSRGHSAVIGHLTDLSHVFLGIKGAFIGSGMTGSTMGQWSDEGGINRHHGRADE